MSLNASYMPWLAVEESARVYLVVRDHFGDPFGPRIHHKADDGTIFRTSNLEFAWKVAARLNGRDYALECLPKERRPGEYILTKTGRKFWPHDPKPEDICLRDIATGLAHRCRFNGHVPCFYSVAAHSILGAEFCGDRKWFLLHDAAEAYLPDICSPVKTHYPQFKECEQRILKAIAERYGLEWPIPDCVWETDIRMLATEVRYLFDDYWGRHYPRLIDVEPFDLSLSSIENLITRESVQNLNYTYNSFLRFAGGLGLDLD